MKLKNYLIIFTIFLVLMCCVNAINASPNDKLDMNVLELDSSVDYISISNELDDTKEETIIHSDGKTGEKRRSEGAYGFTGHTLTD